MEVMTTCSAKSSKQIDFRNMTQSLKKKKNPQRIKKLKTRNSEKCNKLCVVYARSPWQDVV